MTAHCTLGARGLSRALISLIFYIKLHDSYIFAARQASGWDSFDSAESITITLISESGCFAKWLVMISQGFWIYQALRLGD